MACSNDTVVRGSLGKVKAGGAVIARVKNWEISHSVEETAWGDSDSAGYTNRVKGREDATGSMTGVLDTAPGSVYSAMAPGDVVAVILFQTALAKDYWYFPCALIKSFGIAFNMDSKEAVEWKADFGADGKFYKPGTDPGAQAFPA